MTSPHVRARLTRSDPAATPAERLWVLDASGKIMLASDVHQQPRTSLVAYIHPEEQATFQRRWQSAISEGRGWTWQCRLDEENARYTLTCTPVTSSQSDGQQWVCRAVPQPISAIDPAEALKAYEELESVYDTAPLGLALIDREYRYVRINERLAEINGYSVAEHLGHTIREIVPDIADQAESLVDQIFQTGQPLTDIELSGETRADPGVRHTWTEHWYPVMDQNGQPAAISVIVEDVTNRKQIEREMMMANLRFELAETAARGYSFDWDWQSGMIRRSAAVERVTGYSTLELPPTWEAWTALKFPADVTMNKAQMMDWIRNLPADQYDHRYRIRHRDGSIRWLHEYGLVLRNETGDIERIIGQSVDITEHVLAQEKLKESEQRLRLLADNVSQMVWMAHADGYIFWYNQRWYDYTGLPEGTLDGWGWQQIHDPDMLPLVNRNWKASLLSGEPFEMTFPLRGADGHYRMFLTRVMPVRDDHGQIVYWFGTNTDISEHQRLLEETARQAEQLRTIFGAMTDGVMMYDNEGSIVQENAAVREIMGLDAFPHYSELPLPQRTGLIPVTDGAGEPIEIADRPFMRAMRGEVLTGANAQDIWIHRPQGDIRTLSVTAAPLHAPDGAISGVVAVYRDVSERRRLEEAVRESERQKDEFLGIAAHELRTPLTSAKSNGQLLVRKIARLQESTPETVVAALPQIGLMMQRSVIAMDRLSRLVSDLLDISRIQAGKLDLRLAAHDLSALITQTVQEMQEEHPERHITLTLPQEPIELVMDSERIVQVVLNFLTNAQKYSPLDKPIAVRALRQDNAVRVEVCDEGPGLTLDQQRRLFERFYRVEGIQAFQGSGAGLGLGLYISQTIIERHNGKIGVDSMPGRGSTFWFTVPVIPD